jgi:hypothetical protein
MAEYWHRIHRLSPKQIAQSRVLSSPCDESWIATVEAPLWRMTQLTQTLQAAQRWADDLVCSMHPHDCRQTQCKDWDVNEYRFGQTESVS